MSRIIKKFVLMHEQARRGVGEFAMLCEDGVEVIFAPPIKTREQESVYHIKFQYAAEHCRHLNQEFSDEGWKRLFVDQFAREMLNDPTCDPDVRENLGEPVKMVPSLDGRAIVSVGIQTRTFRKKTAALFLAWLDAAIEEYRKT